MNNEKLQQGDYVRNLTEEQFDELVLIGKRVALTWEISRCVCKGYISKSLVFSKCGNLDDTKVRNAKTELTFEEFKQRAINTFQNAN